MTAELSQLEDKVTGDLEIAKVLGRNIAEARAERQVSMRKVAAASGISQPFLSQIESGRTMPSLLTLYRIARTLGLSAADLLPAKGTESPVKLIRRNQAEVVRVSEAENSALGRVITSAEDPVAISEYTINPGEDMGDWYQSDGDLFVYAVEGSFSVRIEGHGEWNLEPGDLVEYPGRFRNVWILRGDKPAKVLLVHVPGR